MERNADVVRLATYAPLFAHAEAWQWRPDLVWFDNTRVLLTPNYYVQQLYSLNKGTHTLALTENGVPPTGQEGLYASAVLDKERSCVVVKAVNASDREMPLVVRLNGLSRKQAPAAEGTVVYMQSDDESAVNTSDNPVAVAPHTGTIALSADGCTFTAMPHSFQVVTIPLVRK